jgi:hypothetical protein
MKTSTKADSKRVQSTPTSIHKPHDKGHMQSNIQSTISPRTLQGPASERNFSRPAMTTHFPPRIMVHVVSGLDATTKEGNKIYLPVVEKENTKWVAHDLCKCNDACHSVAGQAMSGCREGNVSTTCVKDKDTFRKKENKQQKGEERGSTTSVSCRPSSITGHELRTSYKSRKGSNAHPWHGDNCRVRTCMTYDKKHRFKRKRSKKKDRSSFFFSEGRQDLNAKNILSGGPKQALCRPSPGRAVIYIAIPWGQKNEG